MGRIELVLVHGFPLDQTLWDGQLPLEEKGARIIRFDLPGFGGTRAAGAASMEGYVDAVLAAMDGAGVQRSVLCGLSMGGYILFELWRRHPERVKALVLCDTRAEPDTDEGRATRRQGIQLVRDGRRQELLDGYVPKLLAPASFADPVLLGKVRAMNGRAGDEGIIAALQAMHDRPDSTPTLATIRVPTLLVVGAEDAITPPAAARAMLAGIPESQLREIPGAGHLSPLERPDAVNAAISAFLAGL